MSASTSLSRSDCSAVFFVCKARLLIAQRGELLLDGVELAGVGLHLLLLAAHIVQTLNIAADAVFVAGELASLLIGILQGAVVLRDQALLVGDALQLAAAGIAQRAILRCS